ncbi:MAG: polysaccharide biosynthesis PFTS motif protein [Rhizobiaceae bacterium]|nr:polysaccharide biosynthesis PFTS motif protein [Rhizobiaceae bacterium]
MTFASVSRLVERRRAARLRRVMRGHRQLRESGRIELLDQLLFDLCDTPLFDGAAGRVIFGAEAGEGEAIVRQYLLTRFAALDFKKAVLAAIADRRSPVAYPLPAAWRDVVARHGISISRWQCKMLWYCYVCVYLALGVGNIAKLTLTAFKRNRPSLGGTAFFDQLSANNLPFSEGGPGRNIVAWYIQWDGRLASVRGITHQVKGAADRSIDGLPVRRVDLPFPTPCSASGLARFLSASLIKMLAAAADALRGRWWGALMLAESVRVSAVAHADTDELPADYLFHNSAWLYRPMWTYEAERQGSRILFYFYSTNCELFKRSDGYPRQTGCWELSTWSNYLVWDELQAEFVRRTIGDRDITVVGPIWFSDAPADLPAIRRPSIAAFDVQPMREGFYRTLGLGVEYYVPDVACRFASDIAELSRELGFMLLWKQKRDIGSFCHPRYRALLYGLVGQENVCELEPAIAAQRIIGLADIVVSMPFTSTALIARAMGKPSCYYDPLALLQKDDRAAHGIPLLQSVSELRAWIDANAPVGAAKLELDR